MTAKAQLFTYHGDQLVPVSKAEVRRWVKRVREDLREVEWSLRGPGVVILTLQAAASDAAGAAAELQTIAEATLAVAEGVTA